MNNNSSQVWKPLIFSVVLVSGMFLGYTFKDTETGNGFFSSAKKTSIQQVLDLVNMKYVDEIPDSINEKTINQILHQLDPHSVFIPASDLDFINDELRGNFSGIGVEFQIFSDTLNVLNVIENGPAAKAGLQVGDKFIKINDKIAITGDTINPDKVRKLLRGETGSSVKILIKRDKELLAVNVIRGIIPVPSVDAAYMITPTTGFIHLNKFSEVTYPEFMRALEKLQAQKMQNLILDLRGNGGGLLSQAVNIADEFLDENKLIVYTKGNHVPKYEYSCKRDGLFETGKLAVLIDEGSASASEVLGGALQDWDRATIIGRRSFGKGLVQEQFELKDGSALRLTVARYYTPLGRNIQKPYTQGYDKYEGEVTERFNNGEVIKGDTSVPAGPSFKTPKGHIVYGGGGITPDVFVPFDTSRPGNETTKLYKKGTLNNFVYSWYMQQKNRFGTYKNPTELSAYKPGEEEWNALTGFAKKDSVDLSKASATEKAGILEKIPALMARQIWRYEGYYKVANQNDDFIRKALEVLK